MNIASVITRPVNVSGTFSLLFGLLAMLSASVSRAQVLIDPAQAFGQAQASGKPVLVVFSGSDWCAPCIRLEREVLSDSAFLRHVHELVILLKADFPQRKKQEQALRVAYEQLAETYNRTGEFPKIVLISLDRKRVSPVASGHQTPATLVAQLQRILNQP